MVHSLQPGYRIAISKRAHLLSLSGSLMGYTGPWWATHGRGGTELLRPNPGGSRQYTGSQLQEDA